MTHWEDIHPRLGVQQASHKQIHGEGGFSVINILSQWSNQRRRHFNRCSGAERTRALRAASTDPSTSTHTSICTSGSEFLLLIMDTFPRLFPSWGLQDVLNRNGYCVEIQQGNAILQTGGFCFWREISSWKWVKLTLIFNVIWSCTCERVHELTLYNDIY